MKKHLTDVQIADETDTTGYVPYKDDDLLNTIKVPRNLQNLTSQLPKSKYGSTIGSTRN
jgi:hypothetical protein